MIEQRAVAESYHVVDLGVSGQDVCQSYYNFRGSLIKFWFTFHV
jgi:hypothetical protein